MSKLLYTDAEWTVERIQAVYDQCEIIGRDELRLTWYDNEFQIVSYEEMLDAYSSIGMPMMYNHWSFGKSFIQNAESYKRGHMGLALEMVINTEPCINYLMDENTMTSQALVIAHAAIGHNSFFKNNYLFKQWTRADTIVDYLDFAKKYIAKCEEKYGLDEVEATLDAAHALMEHGVDRYHKPKVLTAAEEVERQKRKAEYEESQYSEIWNLIPKTKTRGPGTPDPFLPGGNEENLLYFLEKKSPILKGWQREILRIVRKISQYLKPQGATKTINEGWASTVHYYIMNRLYDKGMIDEGAMLEFLALHVAVVRQEPYDSKYFSGFNPYHLGFNIFKDIKRICQEPTEEDMTWFPDIAGSDWVDTWKYAYENFRDDSFIQQFLSPHLIREMGLFAYLNDEDEDEYMITNIHNERGYKAVRNLLAEQHSVGSRTPDIQVSAVDFDSRECVLTHFTNDDVHLVDEQTIATLDHFEYLWGFPVTLHTRDRNTNSLLMEYP